MFDHNIITVDWGKAAKINFYGKIIHRAKVVGMKVAELIDVLVNQGLVTCDAIHMIGHSAGAHVMGVAGAFVKSGAMGRISGGLMLLFSYAYSNSKCDLLWKNGSF